MEAAATLRSFDCTSVHEKVTTSPSLGSASSMAHIISVPRRGMAAWPTSVRTYAQGLTGGNLTSSTRSVRVLVASSKTSETAVSSEASVPPNGSPKIPKEKQISQRTTFPNAFETLLTEVCDETSVAELKLKIGGFEMHVKRNIGATDTPIAISSPVVAPPIPSEPMDLSGLAKPSPVSPKSVPEKPNPFVKASSVNSGKLSALEASGSGGFKLVSSPVVGSFSRGRMVKGKKHPPVCKEGDLIKEGQIIGYVDQFGTQLPVKSDVDGELLKVLFNDGEAVGYGDPLVAILPSFHGLN
ncbi:hypothetical protein V2J09_014124 [Rumex salicifolius]